MRPTRLHRGGGFSRHPNPSAFTLIELLVVIGIIGLLISMLLPALSGARRAAKAVKASSDLRQLLLGYTAYSLDHKGALLWGYTPLKVNGVAIEVFDPRSGRTFGAQVANRYPWRLLKWCGNIWPILHNHTTLPPIPERGDSSIEAGAKAYILSLNPTFGINAVFLGGQYGPFFRGFVDPTDPTRFPNDDGMPNTGKHVAFKASDVRHASLQIVFCETVAKNAGTTDPDSGLHYATPPRAGGPRWHLDAAGKPVLDSGVTTGLPTARFGKNVLIGCFDGHVEALPIRDLLDMRRWAPKADRPDYDY